MNLIDLQAKYNTHEKCIRHLEHVRWAGEPVCPNCEASNSTKRKNSIKHHCNECNKDFTVLKGTIFEASKLPLNKWFILISLMINAKKGTSSMQLSRDLQVPQKTAWYSAMRVRCAMLDDAYMLEGIVEMDEVYIGGKPRRRNNWNRVAKPMFFPAGPKRGRGTTKIPVVGIVEREGKKRVVAKVMDRLTSKDLLEMLKTYVIEEKSMLMTDEFKGYHQFDKIMQHATVNHSKGEYARGEVHTNTIEGFWSIIKNGIRGQYHVISRKYLPFYLAEFSYKYNHRGRQKEGFDETIENAVSDEKCLVNGKPKEDAK